LREATPVPGSDAERLDLLPIGRVPVILTDIRNVIVSLAVPPLGLVFLALAGLFLLRARPRLGQGCIAVGLLGLALLATPLGSDALLWGLEHDLPLSPPHDDPPRAIVVLGAETIRTRGGGTDVGHLTLERIRAAAALQRATGLPILTSGGTTQADAPPVSVLMAASLRRDFRATVTWIEPKSRDTWENAAFSAGILRSSGIRSVYVVTNAWHMKRALIAFRHTDLVVTAAPTELRSRLGPGLADFLPRATSWEYAWYGIHEWLGCAWYALR
jgi:uncharacterized SAM-binding protein YcdF (DUF218 family)